jgi:hypothetical protein
MSTKTAVKLLGSQAAELLTESSSVVIEMTNAAGLQIPSDDPAFPAVVIVHGMLASLAEHWTRRDVES